MGKISSLRPGNSEMIVPYNEHPHKLKNGGKVKAMANGGMLEGDPTKTTTTTTPVYDPVAFKAAVDARKGKQIPVNPQTGMIDLPPGAFRSQVPLLTGDIKKKQAALDAYMKASKLTSLTPQQSTEALSKAGLGTYNDYISQVNDYGAYRNLTVVPKQELNTTTELLPDSQRYGTTTSAPEGTGTQYSYQETTPYDSTHAQKLFPKDTYVAPQKKASGGKVHKGGIKGYIEGGTIDDGTTVRDTSVRKYSNKPSDYLRDFAVGNADIALNGLGLENAIQDKDYKTKTGSQFNAVSRGVGTIGRGVTGAVVDYFVPGMGTGINSILNQGTKYTGEDAGINEKDKATQDKVAGSLSVVGSTVGSMLGNRQQKQATADPNANVDENGINTKTGEIATVVAGQKQPVTQVTDGNQLTGQALNDWKSATTGEAQAAVLAKYNRGEYQGLKAGGQVSVAKAKEILHDGTANGKPLSPKQKRFFGAKASGKAEGGQIKGPGNGKSDSIPAEPEEGSFVVPAENAHIAVELRKKYLGDSANKKADLHVKGGVKNVALSNGEHMFTKDEADILRAKGINLDALAPNADDGNSGKADGGDINSILAELNQRESDAKAKEKKRQEEAAARIKAENDAEKKAELQDLENKALQRAQNNLLVLKDKKEQVYKAYERYKNAPETVSSKDAFNTQVQPKQYFVRPLKEAIASYQNYEKELFPEKFSDESSSSAEPTTKKLSALDDLNKQVVEEQKKLDASRKNRTPEQTAIAAGIKNNPSMKGAVKNAPNGMGVAGVGKSGKKELSMAESKKLNKGIETLPVRQVALEETTPAPPEEMAMQTPSVNAPAAATGAATEKKKFNPFEKLDIGKGIAVGQTALGIEQLLQDGHRPEDSLDPDFSRAVDRAKMDANTGISPLEREIANRSIDRNRAADIQSIINLSGGSAGTALGNIRAASIAANESKNNLSAMSEQLRMQKQQYADRMVGSKADMSRRLFEDKLGAFKENQAAGAELVGAGIKNLIGSTLYDKELTAQQERQKMYNPTFTV